jgi:hypothetical protein
VCRVENLTYLLSDLHCSSIKDARFVCLFVCLFVRSIVRSLFEHNYSDIYFFNLAVRLARMNQYTDEGAVEVFHNGSWGMVGNPGFKFNDKTASYLCNRFNLG